MLTWQYPWQHLRFFAPDDDKGGAGSGGGGGDAGGTGDAGGDGGGDDGGTPALTDEAWYAALEEGPKGLVDRHVAGLKSALKSQSDQRKTLAKQVRDATAKLEEGSEARKSLEAMTAKLEVAEQRAQFYEDASKPEVGCSNPALAYLAAKDSDLFDTRGNVNWPKMKTDYPELFGKKVWPRGDAGVGGGQQGTKKPSMNAWIRAASGRTG